jgi:hypothetical protein
MNNTNSWEGMLLDIVKSTKEGVAKGVDIAMEQAPEIVNQLLAWKIADNCIRCAGCLLLLTAICLIYRMIWKRVEDGDYDGFIRGMVGLVGGVMAIALVICAFEYAMAALKIYIAPKIYLIEYFSRLIR